MQLPLDFAGEGIGDPRSDSLRSMLRNAASFQSPALFDRPVYRNPLRSHDFPSVDHVATKANH
jgi:hypothetical protein